MRAFPLSDTVHGAEPVPAAASVAKRESADDYPALVAVLNPGWRVIECRDAIQWILQRRHGQARWEGRRYHRTSSGLMRSVRELAGEIEPVASATLESLPDWIGGRP